MPPRARRSSQPIEPVDERPGSGQSPASLAKDRAAQAELLAAAKSGKKPAAARAGIRKSAPNHTGKKVFVFKKLAAEASSSQSSRRGGKKKLSPAILSFFRAKYQKGDFKDALSGAVYMRGKPRYTGNATFKDKVGKILLAEPVRWNDEMKIYTGKVWTPEQAIKVREAMKMVSEEDEADLTDGVPGVPTDEEIYDVFDFEQAKSVDIQLIAEFDNDGEETVAVGGCTFAWKDVLMEHGFEFDGRTRMWHAPAGTDTDEIEAMMDEYGFAVEKFDTSVQDA